MTQTSFEREVIERLVRFEVKLDGLYEILSDVEHDLYGNGQPGTIKDVEVLKTQMAERTQPASRTQTIGVPAAVSALFYAVLKFVEMRIGGSG